LGVLLLLVPEKPVHWLSLIGILLLVVILVSLLGSIVSTEGRFVAATKITLTGSLLLGFVWMFALLGTIGLVRKKYSRSRFNLLYLAALYVFQILGIYLVILAMGKVNGPWSDLGGNPVVILLGALVLTLLIYLISIPYLLLCRYAEMYRNRFAALVNASPSDK
jgi:hypothetical protein